ncbi:hypothetical protein LB506_004224 [Fusarium annulatum]|nr:hypothetical protein LB506_004224 [Fusarium annulatum]
MFSRLARCPGTRLFSRPGPLSAAVSGKKPYSLGSMLSREAKRRQREAQSEMGMQIEKSAHKTTIQRTETSQIRMKRQALDGKSTAEYRTFPNMWLRDNCQCSQCVNQDTKQRNIDTFQLREEDLKVVDFKETEDKLLVNWSDGHESQHPLSYLHCWFRGAYSEEFGKDHMIRLWDSTIETHPPSVPYNQFFVDHGWEAIGELTKKIRIHGFCFVTDAPVYPESTEDLLKRLGPIRNTHYGGFYDFTPDLAMADTAYTNLALPAHTDTTYFTEPAGLQAFHCLSHEPAPGEALEEGESLGGESLLVDGFNAAVTLRKENPWAFKTLAQVELPWHASGNVGISISPDKVYPVIEQEEGGHLKRIRWNNDDRGAVSPYDAKNWYAAARVWNEILRRKENEYWFKLEPGKIVIFNNWRVLHGRSAFKGIRRICGAYIPYDDFVSCYRVTNTPGGRVAGRSYNNRTRMGYSNRSKNYKDITEAPKQEAPVIQKS